MERYFPVKVVLAGIFSGVVFCHRRDREDLQSFILQNCHEAEDTRMRRHLINQYHVFMQPGFTAAAFDFLALYHQYTDKRDRAKLVFEFVNFVKRNTGAQILIRSFY